MAIESPLFQSSMELLGHSITHFNGRSELDRKLVILHLSNAVELLMKDMVLDAGISIYKNPKETITIHGCIEALNNKKVSIPYINKIELLIDERNALQHRFGSPNELTAIFYMNLALDFFRQVLKDNYGQEFDETIVQFTEEKDLATFKMREPSNDSELENLKKLANVHPLGALLSAIAYMEKSLLLFYRKVTEELEILRRSPMILSMPNRALEHLGVELPENLEMKLIETRKLRNLAAHGRTEPSKQDVINAISTVEELERFLSLVDIKKARKSALEARELRLKRHSEGED